MLVVVVCGVEVMVNETQRLTARDGQAQDYYGYDVGVSGDWLVVGAPFDDDKVSTRAPCTCTTTTARGTGRTSS